jgi:c-di-GMP-binding flagellar brake protein YcgR
MPAYRPPFATRQPVLLEVGASGQLIGWRAAIETVDGDSLVLTGTDTGPAPKEFRRGAHVAVTAITRSGVYTSDAVVVERSPRRLTVDVPHDAEPVQRRQYVRVDAGGAMTCLLLDERTNTFTAFAARVHDIGGGGVALAADVIAPRGAVVVCSLAVPDERPLVMLGHVLEPIHRRRGDPHPAFEGSGSAEYVLRVQFSAMSQGDRERLIRFVFTCMRAGHANPEAPEPVRTRARDGKDPG